MERDIRKSSSLNRKRETHQRFKPCHVTRLSSTRLVEGNDPNFFPLINARGEVIGMRGTDGSFDISSDGMNFLGQQSEPTDPDQPGSLGH